MIISENISVKIELPITSEKIQNTFNEKGIKPLRWALVNIDDNIVTISVSYSVTICEIL